MPNQDEHPVTPTPPITAKFGSQRKAILISMTTAFLIIALIVFFYWLMVLRFEESTDDAYVVGNMVALMPQVPGTVVAIKADDTDLVLQNQPVVLLDDTDTKIALARAEDNLAATIRQVRELYENANQLKANIAVQEAQYANALADFNRRQQLLKTGAIAYEDWQHSQTSMNVAKSSLDLARHQYQAAEALVENTDLLHYPTVQQAEAQLRQAYIDEQRTIIRAPVTGFVAKRSAQVGQQVGPGTELLAIIPLNQIWVEANFKEVQLGNVRIGQPATFTADIYHNKVIYHGKVIGIGAGTGSLFSILPPQNATGNWIKIVQRLPTRISIDPKELTANPLRMGLSVQVTVDTHERKGQVLASSPENNTQYQTPIYQEEERGVEQIIQQIIAENAGPYIPSSPKAANQPQVNE